MSAVETLVGVFVSALIFVGIGNSTMFIARATDEHQTRVPLASSGRAAVDEILYQLRGGSAVLASHTFSDGTTITTGTNSIVVQAIAYDPSSSNSNVVLKDQNGNPLTDYIGLTLQNQQLLEYVDAASGSYRHARRRFVVAASVSNDASTPLFTYHVRQVQEQFSQSLGTSGAVTLSLNSAETPVGSVTGFVSTNGATAQGAAVAYNASARTAVLSGAAAGVDTFYIKYNIAPKTLTPGSATFGSEIGFTSQVDVLLNLTGQDARKVSQTITATGSAFLRNNARIL